jgi:hypothetical protein
LQRADWRDGKGDGYFHYQPRLQVNKSKFKKRVLDKFNGVNLIENQEGELEEFDDRDSKRG